MKRSIHIKRVYDPAADDDGTRILVDRLWPRGLSKGGATLDGWNKHLAPTPDLRKWFDHRPQRFAEFRRRYRDELSANAAVKEALASMGRGRTTLLYAARDPEINHAVILAEYLREAAD